MSGPIHSNKNRLLGLDIMRVVAVLMVVSGHFLEHGKLPKWLYNCKRVGIFGVEIFFVLSGFLIGGILLKEIKSGRFTRVSDLGRFWFRRWMRTLPLYYLFFFLYLRFEWTGPYRFIDHWNYLFFWQNFAWEMPDFYIISWSLAIEEFFYLLFPLFLWLLLKVQSTSRAIVIGISTFFVFPVILRALTTPFPDWHGFDFDLRMMTIKRLDAPMYGVAAVYLKEFWPEIWRKLDRWTPFFATLFIAACVHIYIFDNRDLWIAPQNWPLQTFYFPILLLLSALLLPYFSRVKGGESVAAKSISYLALISYSIYLVHPLVITFVRDFFDRVPGRLELMDEHYLISSAIYTVIALAASSLTYFFWEKPFLFLRDFRRENSR